VRIFNLGRTTDARLHCRSSQVKHNLEPNIETDHSVKDAINKKMVNEENTMKYIFKGLGVAFLLALSFSYANAQIVNFNLEGEVTGTDDFFGANPFGLSVGNIITATGSYDDIYLTGSGYDDIELVSLNVSVGDTIYTEADANWLGSEISFLNGWFYGLYFDTEDNEFNSDYEFGGYMTNFDGEWTVYSESAPAVPVPAAVWLFGSGLLGLVGMARRKKA